MNGAYHKPFAATLDGFLQNGGPYFPSVTDEITRLYVALVRYVIENELDFHLGTLDAFGGVHEGFVRATDPVVTQDGSSWYGMLFEVEGIEVMILLPWVDPHDFETESNHSVAFYVRAARPDVPPQKVANAINRHLEPFAKRIKRLFEEYVR